MVDLPPSTFVYGPVEYRYRLNGGHRSSRARLAEAACVWSRERWCSVPLSHFGSEFTRDRQRRLLASTFGRRRKSVWFEVVCGSPSCGFRGAHSSQCECASLERDQRAGCCCFAAAAAAPWISETPEDCHSNQTQSSVQSQNSSIL